MKRQRQSLLPMFVQEAVKVDHERATGTCGIKALDLGSAVPCHS